MKTLPAGLMIVTLMALSTPMLHADPIVKDYRAKRVENGKDFEVMKVFILGMGSGLIWATAFEASDHQKRLFCPPDSLGLNGYNYLNILDDELERQSKIKTKAELDDMSIGMLLTMGLQETFPCKTEVK